MRIGKVATVCCCVIATQMLLGGTHGAGELATTVEKVEKSSQPAANTNVAPDVIATVLDKPITRGQLVAAETEYNRERQTAEEFAKWQRYSRRKLLLMAIGGPLRRAYAEREGLEPTEAEIEKLAELLGTASKQTLKDTTPQQRAGMKRVSRIFAEATLLELKIAHAQWKEHGGAIGAGSLGSCVAFVGERAQLEADIEAERLVFHDAEIEAMFWDALADHRQRADVVIKEPERVAEFFAEQMARVE